MVYYRRMYYGWNRPTPVLTRLTYLFGDAVKEIRKAFLSLNEGHLDKLLTGYGAVYGSQAETYARKTFPKWKSGATNLSGQTMRRLIEMVPPYLSAGQRFVILQSVLKLHKKTGSTRTIKIDISEPASGYAELQATLASMSHDDVLAHLPESVMGAATWLYNDDITTARAMLAEAERKENDLIRSSAVREIELLMRTISSARVKTANYSVEMPSGKLHVAVYTPSVSTTIIKAYKKWF
jgi:hypothetical protein